MLRKKSKESTNGFAKSLLSTKGEKEIHRPNPKEEVKWSLANIVNILVGSTLAVVVGVAYASYARQIHENDMWFSNIGVSVSYSGRVCCFFFHKYIYKTIHFNMSFN